jgi:hypothetical protein
MGIFDLFTGKPATDAAAANTARLGQLKTEGMGYLDAGKTGALGSLDNAGANYAGLQNKFGAGSNLYLDSLGVNGADGNARATGAFQAGPGYQYAVDQSLDGLNRSAAARGNSIGGNTLAALSDRAGNMANQEYGNWQTKLGGLISPEMQAASGTAGIDQNKAGVYTNDANSRVSLASGVTNGINDAATQGANAQMAGSKNIWDLGMNLAKLGVGAFTGGGSLLGGGAGGATQLNPNWYGQRAGVDF